MNIAALEALVDMHHSSPHHPPADPLDGLIAQLLDCGGVLSQVIASMYEYQADGHPAPDAAPVPEIAHMLVRDVSAGVRSRHSRRDLNVAATIIGEVTEAVCEDLYVLGPELG